MSIISVFRQMGILFVMMAAGYAANKAGIMGRESEGWLSKLVVNVTCPALIIVSVTTSERLESNGVLVIIFLTAGIYYLILPLISKVLIRILGIPGDKNKEYEAMLVYSNIGFMGIPIVNAVLGQEAILYLSVFMAVFNISMFSYGILLLGDGNSTFELRRIINPGTVSAIAAVVMYMFHITLPPIIGEGVNAIGGVTTPLAMLVIGSSLANHPIKDVLKEKSLYPLVLLGLVVLPLIFFLLGRIIVSDRLLLGVMVLATAMPVASNVVMLKNEANGDAAFVTKGVFLTNVLSLVTIPLVAALLK